jgi:heat shock protein HtpX
MLSGSQYKRLDDVDSSKLTREEKQVLNMVEEMSISAGLGYVPKTYIMETQEMNAFAAGWNEENALVAVTRGLMTNLNRAETQAVIAHEVGHIIHGDSKLTLYVGIMANVVLTFTNIFAHLVWFFGRGGGSAANKARLIIIVLNIVLPIITQILYLYLSRKREYMADAVAVKLTGDNQAMINALRKISGNHQEMKYKRRSQMSEDDLKEPRVGDNFRGAANIFETGDSIFSTHPSINNRIKKLGGEVEE